MTSCFNLSLEYVCVLMHKSTLAPGYIVEFIKVHAFDRLFSPCRFALKFVNVKP